MQDDTERVKRTDAAMGEAMYAMHQSLTAEERKDCHDNPFSHMRERMEHDAKEVDALSKEEQELLKELCSFFDIDHEKGDEKKEVARAKEIIEELQMDVNFPALPYGETFLSGAVNHSLDMMKMMIEKGADVNKENEMISETPIDALLEIEEDRGLSNDEKAMKELLLSKGAKTAEQRWREVAASVRQNGGNDSEDDDSSGSDEEKVMSQ